MKRALASFLLAVSVSPVACGGPQSTPEGSVREFLDALETRDSAAFRQSFTERSWELVAEIERLSAAATDGNGQALTIDEWCRAFCGGTVEGSSLRGDSATVRVRMGETVDEVLVARVGDQWKIDLEGKLTPAVQMLRLAAAAIDTAAPADTAASADTVPGDAAGGSRDTLPGSPLMW